MSVLIIASLTTLSILQSDDLHLGLSFLYFLFCFWYMILFSKVSIKFAKTIAMTVLAADEYTHLIHFALYTDQGSF